MKQLCMMFALMVCLPAQGAIPTKALPWVWEGDSDEELPVVEMEINGQKVRAFFDTGANGITMGEKTAARLGLIQEKSDLNSRAGKGVFAGGKVSETWNLAPVTLKVGNREFSRFPAKVVRGADASPWRDITVGVELLKRARVLVDYKARTLRVLDRAVIAGKKQSVLLPVELVKGTHLLVINSRLNGTGTRLHFDTGGTFALNVFSQEAARLGLHEEARKSGGHGGGGGEVSVIHYRQPVRVCLRSICESVPAIAVEGQDEMWRGISKLHGHEIRGQISHQFLLGKQVEYDLPARKIWIRPVSKQP